MVTSAPAAKASLRSAERASSVLSPRGWNFARVSAYSAVLHASRSPPLRLANR
jgi:hypothetical protein